MTKRVFALLGLAALLTACGGEQKQTLEQALVAKLQNDSDLKDYKLAPQDVAKCVLEEISNSLPVFPGDPRRGEYFDAYAKFLSADSSAAAQQALDNAAKLFGSVKEARKAAVGVTDFIISCMGELVETKPLPGDSAPPQQPAQPGAPAAP